MIFVKNLPEEYNYLFPLVPLRRIMLKRIMFVITTGTGSRRTLAFTGKKKKKGLS